jgi:DNA repair ATPase RecN
MDKSNLEALLAEHLKADQNRLDRIEDKIDKLSETVIAIARAEEKLISLESARNDILDTLENHEERLDKHAERLNAGSVTLNNIQRLFWICVSAAVAALAGAFFM